MARSLRHFTTSSCKQSSVLLALTKNLILSIVKILLIITITIDHQNRQQSVYALVIDKQSATASQTIDLPDNNNNQHNENAQRQQQITSYEPTIPNEQQQQQTKSPQIAYPVVAQSTSINQQQQQRDYKRPIWNIAHMVNSIKELDYRLSKGANAVEADVTFNALGQPIYVYHGPPCDCWRHCHQQEDFDDYLAYVHEIALAEPLGIGRNLSLLFLDLKLDHLSPQAKERAGIELAQSVMDNLYPRHTAQLAAIDRNSRKKLRLILSINHVTDIELVNNFIHHLEQHNSSDLMQRIGFDVGMNDDIQQIETMWKRFGRGITTTNLPIGLNLWQGDGYTNCISPFYNLGRLSTAIAKRDNEFGYPRKVYQWTVDLHDRIREAFLMGVDAIMTNHPERVLAVLGETEIAHNFRLATNEDDPFRKIPTKSITHRGGNGAGGARYPRTISPVSGGFMGSLMDVINSWVAYIREIPFLSLPTTSRIFSSIKRQFKFRSTSPTAPIAIADRSPYEQGHTRQQTTQLPVAYPQTSSVGSSQTISRTFDGQQTQTQNLPIVKRSTTTTTTTTRSTTTMQTSTQAPSIVGDQSNMDEAGAKTTTTMISNVNQLNNDTQAKNSSETSEKLPIVYEPKWYTSLASNILISMLKIALPPTNTTTSTTTAAPTTIDE